MPKPNGAHAVHVSPRPRHQGCPACGARFATRAGRIALVLEGAGARLADVCPECAARGLVVVRAGAAGAARAVLAPYADHLRKLGSYYGGDRGEGLIQAAGLLEAGRLDVDDPHWSLSTKAIRLSDIQDTIDRRREPSPPPPPPPPFAERDRLNAVEVSPPAARPPKKRVAGALPPIERAILTVLVQRAPASTSKRQAAVMAGYSVDSGSVSAALARLREAGFMSGKAAAMLPTAEGRAALGEAPPLPRGQALIEHWSGKVGDYAATILQIVTAAYPGELGKDEIAARAGCSAQSGSFSGALGLLRSLALMARKGQRASDELMAAVRAGDAEGKGDR